MSHFPSLRDGPPQLADPDRTATWIEAFIQEQLATADRDRVVVNLSGGLDSTVTATLATRALGTERVTGLVLPTAANASENLADARAVADRLEIESHQIQLQPILDTFVTAASRETKEPPGDPRTASSGVTSVPTKPRSGFKQAVGNAAARLRMAMAYFEANTTDGLVLGTGNRTELLLGYFTKYGDGGVDLLPIGDLYKTEVRELATELGVDSAIITKSPTAGLWIGQSDADELGAPYPAIDTALWNLIEAESDVETAAAQADLPVETVVDLADRYAASDHKRHVPPTAAGTEDGDRPARA